MTEGYIKLWRKSLDTGMLKNHSLWTFWSWCLLKASWQIGKILVGKQEIELLPGQFIFGRVSASAELCISESTIKSYISTLVESKNITIKTTNKFSIITICNWETYQSNENRNNQQPDQLPNQQPDQQRTQPQGHNKEVKKVRKKNKDYCAEPEKELASPQEPVEEIFIELPLNDKTMYPITTSIIPTLSELYPAVDIKQEFRNMRGWLDANPTKKKTLTGVKKFYTAWIAKKQNNPSKNIEQDLFPEKSRTYITLPSDLPPEDKP